MESDPTPGIPDEVRTLAEDLQTFADDVGEALGKIRGLAGDSAVQEWAGLSADAFRDEFDGVPENLTKLQDSYDLCAQALQTYWPKLETAQGQADRALERAIAAQADLTAAQSALGDAQDWVSRAGDEADRLEREGEGAQPPDDAEVRAATRDRQAAQQAQESAQGRVDDAQGRLDAARQLAEEAREMREEAARNAARDIDEASDAGIQNRRWWEDAIHWVTENWDTIVDVCKAIVAVLGIVVMIIGGPLAWVVLAAALVVLADTLIKYANGEASLWDVAFAVLDCIPGMKGLTTLGGLARGLKGGLAAARTGLKGLRQGALKLGRRTRGDGIPMNGRTACGDPVDMATGELLLSATDVSLPGVLPLVLERHHVSSYRRGRLFGRSWASTLDQRLELDEHGATLLTADGMALVYPRPLPGGDPVMPVEGPRWGLAWDGRPSSPLTVHQRETGRTLRFAPVAGREDTELPLQSITDRNGNTIDFAYDRTGTLTDVRHSGGYHIGLDTDRGRVTALRLLSAPGEPVLRRYGHDDDGLLTAVHNSSGRALRLSYDDHARLTRWEDRNGYWYAYEYDAEGRCVFTTGTDRVLEYRYHYDTDNHRTTAVDSLGCATVHQFNDSFQLIAETDPLGHVTTREWDRYDRLLAVTDPLGHTTRHTYDEHGDPVVTTRPDGSTVRAVHDGSGRPTEITQPDGTVWETAYDERGNRVAVTDPAGNRTRYAYDERGAVTGVTDALGNAVRVSNDATGLPLRITDADGTAITCRRDAFGRPVAVLDAVGGRVDHEWDGEGRPLRRTDSAGGVRTWEWDDEGNLLAHTDESGATTCFEYQGFDQVSAQTNPDGTRYEFARDTRLRLVSVRDPAGRAWRYTYDPAGRLVEESDFDGRATRYALDAAGRPLSRTNPAGERVDYRYDALGRLLEKRTADGSVTAYTYDALGRPVRATTPDVDVERRYDPVGNLVEEAVNGRVLRLSYDRTGRVATRVTPAGHHSAWTYTPAGRRAELTTGGRSVSFGHDEAGRPTGRRFGDTLTLTQGWDPLGRLGHQELTAGARGLARWDYTYRPDGCLTALDGPDGHARFTLDEAQRVTAVQRHGAGERYSYDATGNQLSAVWDDPAGDSAGERTYRGMSLTGAGRVSHEYDDAGRTVLRRRTRLSRKPDAWHYTWDAENRLTEVRTPDGARWRYLYDGFGRRVAKRRLSGDTVEAETLFTWHHHLLVEQEERAGGRALTWEYEGLRPITQTERRPRGAAADPDQEETDRRFHAIVSDLVGAPVLLVTEEGEHAWRSRATVWGVPYGDPSVDGTDIPLRFPGQYADEETGWHYNLHRHYDPATARFTTPDPLGLAPAPNPYTYVHNPHTWADPLGLAGHDVDNLVNNMDDNTFFHYTDEAGYQRIMQEWGARFTANDAGKLFFTQDMLSPGDVESFVFIGNPFYRGKGDFMIAFQKPEGALFRPGEQPNEVIHWGGLKISMDDVLFHGRNPF
ncbi:DUF6531 domain-containing protein [Streptomyces sp. RFCAC02]|uniref:DUF6531 domain-containing protein n=1 Tax=Streptomyces sp. RFCAC02 TaxID=2499143 RepID=UPI00143DA484|nr:DUF6531 domain-containing protein [Streptomyces sp. RFCAC02]